MRTVFILASCRKVELLPATLMVFSTIRTGFPKARVVVEGNGLSGEALHQVAVACIKASAEFKNVNPLDHQEWIEELLEREADPFVICDTDVVFWDKVEDWKFTTALAGRLIPEFLCEFTKSRTQRRLHTSLLFMDPVWVRQLRQVYLATIPRTYFTPRPNLIFPQFVPLVTFGRPVGLHQYENLFFDTCAMLYHAIGGAAFTDEQNECYDHLNCGTISDLVGPHMTDGQMGEHHRMIFDDLELARGIWLKQQEYLESRSPNRKFECAPCV